METITLSSDVYQQLIVTLRELQDKVAELSDRKKFLAKEYVDSWEACRILKISRRTLERHRDDNKIPCFKMKRRVFYRLMDLEHYLFQQTDQFKIDLLHQ